MIGTFLFIDFIIFLSLFGIAIRDGIVNTFVFSTAATAVIYIIFGIIYIIDAIEIKKLKATGRWPDPETEDPDYNLIKKLSKLDKELYNGEIDKKTHRILSKGYRERCHDTEMKDPDFDLWKKLHELDMELEAGNIYKKTYRQLRKTYIKLKENYEKNR